MQLLIYKTEYCKDSQLQSLKYRCLRDVLQTTIFQFS